MDIDKALLIIVSRHIASKGATLIEMAKESNVRIEYLKGLLTNGKFQGSLSDYVRLSLFCGAVPDITFESLEEE